jgi:hypothetical protein
MMKALTINKESILKILNDFPQEVVLENFIDRVIMIAKIETARAERKNGKYLTEEEFDEETKSW